MLLSCLHPAIITSKVHIGHYDEETYSYVDLLQTSEHNCQFALEAGICIAQNCSM